jgi:hypothetical protein
MDEGPPKKIQSIKPPEKPISVKSPEKQHQIPKMMFVTETDIFDRPTSIDGAQLRLSPTEKWTHFLLLEGNIPLEKPSLSLIRPDESDQTSTGQAWLIYGDRDTNQFHLKSVNGKFGIPNQVLMIGKTVSPHIFNFLPDQKPDYELSPDRSLQALAMVYKDRYTGEFVIARRLFEQIDMSTDSSVGLQTNPVSLHPSEFELHSKNAPEIKAALNIFADWQKQQEKEKMKWQFLKVIKENAHITALRLAHKNVRLPKELNPQVTFDENTGQYKISLFVTNHGKTKIIGNPKSDDEPDRSQIGQDFFFGQKLFFQPNEKISSDPDHTITGSIFTNKYIDPEKREDKPLIENVTIQKIERKLETKLQYDEIGSPIYEVSFASNHAGNIIEALLGIERGLKPKYLPSGEIFGT